MRILCLHGYAQSGQVLRKQMGGIRKAFRERTATTASEQLSESSRFSIEFVYMDGPHPATAPFLDALDWTEERRKAARAWWNAKDLDLEGMPLPAGTKRYQGFQESAKAVSETLSQGSFDGIAGFSQGAAFAAILARAHSSKLKFAILFSGFSPRDHRILNTNVDAKCVLPTLHVYSNNDSVVASARSVQLASDAFESSACEFYKHDKGHSVPNDPEFYSTLHTFIRKACSSAKI